VKEVEPGAARRPALHLHGSNVCAERTKKKKKSQPWTVLALLAKSNETDPQPPRSGWEKKGVLLTGLTRKKRGRGNKGALRKLPPKRNSTRMR